MKKILIAALAVLLFTSFVAFRSPSVAASATTYTYALDDENRFVRTQDAYLPGLTVTGLGLDKPSDLTIDDDGLVVIADSGTKNRRIVYYDPTTNAIVRTVEHPQFVTPTDVFIVMETSAYVTKGDLYVADPTAEKVFHFNKAGVLIETFGKPASIMYETLSFQPQKVAVDKAGILYLVSKGSSDGIVQLSNTGEFLGFFTSNKVQLNLREQFQQFIYTDEQLTALGLNLTPPVFTSVDIDKAGIVYTSSSGARREDNVKKHNTQGNNMIADIFIASTQLTDVTVDDFGIIYTADTLGFIDVYTNDGEFIYTFGAVADISVAGFFKNLSGIVVDANRTIWTIDSGKNYLQSFVPTEYASKIYEAIHLYNETRYAESIELWQNVLRLNQLSVLAHNGLAKNYLQTEDYRLAAYHFEIAGNRTLYSEAFWEIRNLWLQEYLITIILVGVLIGAAAVALKIADRRKHIFAGVRTAVAKFEHIRFVEDILYAKEVTKKPSDAFYAIKRGHKGSMLGATLVLILTFLSYVLSIAGKSFIFQTVSVQDLDLSSIILGFFLLIGLFVLCSFLVTSIQDGEGTLAEIYRGVAYSMWPFIWGSLLSTAFSYVATNNELFLLQAVFYGGLAWSAILVFVSISEIQNYTFGQTIKSVLFTFLFVIVILLVFSFIQLTIEQLFQFFEELIKEAIRNVLG
jgi:tetratricopeptide (TPR) repeat protein